MVGKKELTPCACGGHLAFNLSNFSIRNLDSRNDATSRVEMWKGARLSADPTYSITKFRLESLYSVDTVPDESDY